MVLPPPLQLLLPTLLLPLLLLLLLHLTFADACCHHEHYLLLLLLLQVHRLGLQQMVGCGHLLVTTGKTGSVKLWPETQLRCTASEAGERGKLAGEPLAHSCCYPMSGGQLVLQCSAAS
jgi:hypothetical protein